MFDGSGVIRSRKGGHLSFEIIGRYPTGFPPLMRQEQGVHGQIPDVDQHVMLRAVAADGREWRSNWVTPRAYPASTKTCTWRVASGIESLLCSETRPQSDSSEGRLYIDSPRLSFDAKTHTVMKAGDDVLLEQWSIDRHEGHLGLAAVSYRQSDRRWLVVRAKQDTPIMPNWAGLVCQGVLPRYRGHFQVSSHRAEGVFMSKRKKYSPEFKREAIELVRRSGASCRQVALEIGVAPNLLTRWVREAQPGTEKAFPGTGSPRDEELARLKRELARVTKERDFLRDAAAYFAKESSSGTR